MSTGGLIEEIRENVRRVSKLEPRSWTAEICVVELLKQAGELAKAILLFGGYYHESAHVQRDEVKKEISDELSDIIYVVVRTADILDIDLQAASAEARSKEREFLDSAGA